MGTPWSDLQPKYSIKGYFTEGEVHARAGKEKEFLLGEIILRGGDATRLL
jgi:hypothetical protein